MTATADPLIARAREREKAGDPSAAADLLSGWLGLNAGAPGSPRVFSVYFQLEQDFPSLMAASVRHLASAKGVPAVGEQFTHIARLFDVSGRIEEARDAYLAAYGEGAPPSTLVSAFLLSLEMNDTQAMDRCLQGLKGKGTGAEALLGALDDLHEGREAAARKALVGLADQTGDTELAVKALWVLYEYSAAQGDAAGQAVARKKLTARFPASPETAIAASAQTMQAAGVFLTPRPETLAAPASDGPAQNEAATAATGTVSPVAAPVPTAAQGTFAVQAGSFQMKENADDLVLELTKKGFAPMTTHETVQGRDRFRVFAGTGLDADAAKALLARLTQEGYSGFVVTEKR